MKLLIFCGVFLVALLLTTTEGRKANGNKGRAKNAESNSTMECLGQNIPEAKITFGMSECMQEIANNQSSLADKPRGRKKAMKKNQMCLRLCQRKKQGILDQDGKLSETGAIRFVEELFPQKARTRIQRGLNRCAEDNGEGFTTTNNCREYKRFEKCMTRIITKACGLKNDNHNGGGRAGKNAGRRNGNKGKNRKQEHLDDEEESED